MAYHLVIEMSGDRVETGKFEVMVRDGEVVSLRRNGLIITPGSGQDYSMDGLFRMLMQELGLSEKPSLLGAPGGYSAYLQAGLIRKPADSSVIAAVSAGHRTQLT